MRPLVYAFATTVTVALAGCSQTPAQGAEPTSSRVAGHDHSQHGAEHPTSSQGEAAQAAPAAGYHCPMHPEVRSDKAASCSKCGMDLVPDEP